MKKHAIIPIFIPHRGCPNDCVFCNQKIITARQPDVTERDIRRTVEQYLSTLKDSGVETIEMAFFGGSFTGLPLGEQNEYLRVAQEYKRSGAIDRIHMSTRPDYIDEEILDNLAARGVDVIELGVQSFDERVLMASKRGHGTGVIYRACEQIKSYGFELGIQLMIGLPGDSRESCIYSAHETVKIKPGIARLYPTVVIEDTELEQMYAEGSYRPPTQEEAVQTTKEMYRIIDGAGIRIIRVGLKSTDLVNEKGRISGNSYHPAFRQLVEGEIAREDLEAQLQELIHDGRVKDGDRVTFLCAPASFSNMVGNRKCNREYFANEYPQLEFLFRVDRDIDEKLYSVVV